MVLSSCYRNCPVCSFCKRYIRRRQFTGIAAMLTGFAVMLLGLALVLDWITNPATDWQDGLKGPVWMSLGFIIALFGWERFVE